MRSTKRTIRVALAGALCAGTLVATQSATDAALVGAVFDDFDDGDASDWAFFGGNAAGGGGGAAADRPAEGSGYFSTGWGGEGTDSGFYGGTFKNLSNDAQTVLPADPWFNMWVLNQSDATVDQYQLEVTLREDTDGTGWSDGAEDSIRLDAVYTAAQFDDEWTLLSAPLTSFVDAGTGGNGVFDGNVDEMVIVIAGVQGEVGSVVEVDFDQITFTSGDPAGPATGTVIDDFETGLPSGAAVPNGEPLGFYTFQGAGSSIAISTEATPPAPVLPAVGDANNVLAMNIDSTSFAGYIHAFENSAVDTWLTQDWSTSEGISFWFDGNNSGAELFIDILDNRGAGSTTDDAERWTVAFIDDFDGWQLYELPFSSFTRKEIGNSAPNDGLGLFEMHGYAFGALGTGGPQTFYFDEVALYGVAEPPALAAQFSVNNTFVEEGVTGQVGVRLNRAMGPDDPAQVSIDFATERSNATPGEEFLPTSGTLTFVNGGPTELFFPIETFDDTKFEGDEQIVIRLTNPVDVERGALFQGSVLIDDNDDPDPKLLDDFELGDFLWESDGFVDYEAQRVAVGDADARPGQDAVENVLRVSVPESSDTFETRKQDVIDDLTALLPASSKITTKRIENAIDRIERGLRDRYWINGWFLDESLGKRVFAWDRAAIRELRRIRGAEGDAARQAIDDLVAVDVEQARLAFDVATSNDGDARDLARAERWFELADVMVDRGRDDIALIFVAAAWDSAVDAIRELLGDDDHRYWYHWYHWYDWGHDDDGEASAVDLGSVSRDFAIGQDWTGTDTLDFWFKGTGSGEDVTLTLKDNRAPDPGPTGWSLAWADEFDGPAGAAPDPANWSYELGDTTPDGKNGWGNEELQYYTDSTDNSATDGDGNLVITLDEADPSLECYYGPCEYESARLISQNKAEFAYGRIESRLKVPTGGDGLWPAFWSLGTDITSNPWPGAGEIDIMEYVSRLPEEIFGTIHGPGYNGGGSFSGIYDFGERVDQDFHTYAVEWEPNLITWYVDGIKYHEARPADVPGPWVFEKPYFLLLNFAIGGNFGGTPDPNNTYPQEYLVDYVRVYQGPDTAERFETTFSDDSSEWQLVSIPVSDFARSDDQPAGAPNDGLSLDDVWGYGFELPYPAAGTYLIDQVRRVPVPPPTELVVTNLDDSGPGSLREALSLIADGGTISFDAGLADGTLTLTTGQLVVDRSVTIDAAAAAPITISAAETSRVMLVEAGATVALADMVIRDGVAAPQGGGISNLGTLSLDRVTVTNNVENSPGPANFAFGGGGIYNGDGATLDLTDSIVSGNSSASQPGGGIYGFFNSTINISNSTISGNVGGDVAGGVRSLGDLNVTGSTISGNTSTAWHGGGIFATDGTVTIVDTQIVDNVGAAGTAGGLMVATFGAPVSVTVQDSVVTGNVSYGCQVEGGAAAVLTSLGGNTFSDASCNPVAGDTILP